MRAAIEIAGWSVVGLLVWTATLSSITPIELVIGLLAAVTAGVLARSARRAIGEGGVPAGMWRAWLGWAAWVPVAAAADLVRILGWLLGGRPEASQSDRVVPVLVPAGDDRAAVAWRQGAVLAVSSTPGSVVLRLEADQGRLILDQLVSGPPHLERRVAQ